MRYKLPLLISIFFICNLMTASASIHLAPKMNKSPSDISYNIGETGNVLVWQFEAHESGDEPSKYTVTIDDVSLENHTQTAWLDNVDIMVNVDGLAAGVHNVKITVADTGTDTNQADAKEDTAVVTVIDPNATSSSSTSVTSSTNTPASSSENADTPYPSIFVPLFIISFTINRYRK